MGMRSPHNERTKMIGMAIGASICAAVATMFVPTALLETMTGATGLSELVPATAAPLGDKARAMIAFGAGAVTMMVAFGLLSRKTTYSDIETKNMATNEKVNSEVNVPLINQIKRRFGGFMGVKMPWTRNAASNDVYELSDLPELRAHDAHPDTPRRRPISAASDFGDVGLDGKRMYIPDVPLPKVAGSSSASAASDSAERDDMPFFADRDADFSPADATATVQFVADPAPEIAEEIATPSYVAPAFVAAPAPVPATASALGEDQPSLAELVASFEQALENRKVQLAALEDLAAQMAAKVPQQAAAAPQFSSFAQPAPAQPIPMQPIPMQPVPTQYAPTAMRMPLEAVPAAVRSDVDADEMDAALNAALATLQRMNAK